MLDMKIYDTRILCDKCDRLIRDNIRIVSKRFIEKYSNKKTYCGRCIQERINRNNKDFDFDKEFSYDFNSICFSKELDEELKLLLSCFI